MPNARLKKAPPITLSRHFPPPTLSGELFEPPSTARPTARDRADWLEREAQEARDAELALCDTRGDSAPVDWALRSLFSGAQRRRR